MQDYKEEMKLQKKEIKAQFIIEVYFWQISISWLQHVAMLIVFYEIETTRFTKMQVLKIRLRRGKVLWNLLEINILQLEISIWCMIKGFWNCPKFREDVWYILNWVGAKLNSFSSLYVRDIFLSGSLTNILICRWYIMNGLVGIKKY
jgi:hypothetical protein